MIQACHIYHDKSIITPGEAMSIKLRVDMTVLCTKLIEINTQLPVAIILPGLLFTNFIYAGGPAKI